MNVMLVLYRRDHIIGAPPGDVWLGIIDLDERQIVGAVGGTEEQAMERAARRLGVSVAELPKPVIRGDGSTAATLAEEIIGERRAACQQWIRDNERNVLR